MSHHQWWFFNVRLLIMNQNLNQELELLITFFWQTKKLSFSKEEYSNLASLEKGGIIKKNGNQYTPANYQCAEAKFLSI
jgi:hypothetical protein